MLLEGTPRSADLPRLRKELLKVSGPIRLWWGYEAACQALVCCRRVSGAFYHLLEIHHPLDMHHVL